MGCTFYIPATILAVSIRAICSWEHALTICEIWFRKDEISVNRQQFESNAYSCAGNYSNTRRFDASNCNTRDLKSIAKCIVRF